MRAAVLAIVLLVVLPAAASEQAAVPKSPVPRDAVVERLDTAYRFEEDGSGSVVQTMRAKVLSAAGRAALGQVYLSTITPIEHGRFEYVRTIKASGRVVEADLAAAVDVRQQHEGGGLGIKAVAVPDLEPGDAVEYRMAKTWEPLAKGQFWLEHPRFRGLPIEVETVSVDVPSGLAVVLRHAPGLEPQVEEAHDRRQYRWTLQQGTAAQKDSDPILFALSTFRDWAEAGTWFLAAQPRSEDEPSVRAKARELVAGVQGARDQALAIFGWVARSVRWVGAPFASDGYRARPAPEVLRTGWGDCKDKHGLLAALLGAVGISAQPVLVSSSGVLPFPDVPAPSQFDHVLTLARVGDEELWLDSTLEVATPGQLLPSIRGSRGLAIGGDRVALVTIPGGPAPSRVRVESIGSVSGAGALDVRTTVAPGGDYELMLRLLLRQGGNEARKLFAKYMATSQVPPTEPSEVTGSDPADLEHPLTITYRVQRDSYAATGNLASAPIPSLLAALTAQGTPVSGGEPGTAAQEKKQPTGPTEVDETITLSFPEGATPEAPLAVKTETPAGSYEASYDVTGARLLVRRTFRTPSFASAEEAAARTASLRALVEKDLAQLVTVAGLTGQPGALVPGTSTPEELVKAAQSAVGQGHTEEAVSLLQAALQQKPTDATTLLALATACRALARWDEAETALRRVLELDPLDPKAGSLLAALLLERQRYPEAIAQYRNILQSNPFDSRSWLALGILYRVLQRPDDALAALESAVKSGREELVPLLALSQLLRESGRIEEAQRYFEQAKALPAARAYPGEFPRLEDPGLRFMAELLGVKSGITLRLPRGATDAGAAERLQSALGHLASLSAPDRDFAVVGDLQRIAEELVRLGRADIASGQLARGQERLNAAFDLTLDGTVAGELADTNARSGQFTEALRMWAAADRSAGVAMPAALKSHVEKSGLQGAALADRVRAAGYELMDRRSAPRGSLRSGNGCPPGTENEQVVVRALVDESGRVAEAVALSGADACRTVAATSLRGVQLPRLVIEGKGVKTARTIVLVFHPAESVESYCGYGLDPFKEVVEVGARVSRPVE